MQFETGKLTKVLEEDQDGGGMENRNRPWGPWSEGDYDDDLTPTFERMSQHDWKLYKIYKNPTDNFLWISSIYLI